jgi:hypothetical protein
MYGYARAKMRESDRIEPECRTDASGDKTWARVVVHPRPKMHLCMFANHRDRLLDDESTDDLAQLLGDLVQAVG